jgi:hypothetical protein
MALETDPSDWSTLYSQYLARSAAISGRTLNLYQLALERVAQGTLPPTIFQDHFPSFALAHGAEFSNRFAEVGSQFLSNVVQLGSKFSHHSPHASEGTAHAERLPEFDADPSRWYEQVAEYAGRLNARAIKAYRSQLDRVAAGEMTPGEVQQQTAEQMARQLPENMQIMTRLYFDLLNGLNDIRSAYEETYFRGLLAAAKPENGEGPAALKLTGPIGSTVTADLSVSNTTRQPTLIGHQVVDARRADGAGPSLIPAVVFVPERLELGPGDEGALRVSLWLDPEQYDPDVLYSGAIYLDGGSEVPLKLELKILATGVLPNPTEH